MIDAQTAEEGFVLLYSEKKPVYAQWDGLFTGLCAVSCWGEQLPYAKATTRVAPLASHLCADPAESMPGWRADRCDEQTTFQNELLCVVFIRLETWCR